MKTLYTILAGLLFIVQSSFAQDNLPKEFIELLGRAQMTFSMPEGYTQTEIIDNPHMSYEYAVRHNTEKFEIRYAIRPMDELLKEYEEKKEKEGTLADVNQIFLTMPLTTALNVCNNEDAPKGGLFPLKVAKTEFNANLGGTMIFSPHEAFFQWIQVLCDGLDI